MSRRQASPALARLLHCLAEPAAWPVVSAPAAAADTNAAGEAPGGANGGSTASAGTRGVEGPPSTRHPRRRCAASARRSTQRPRATIAGVQRARTSRFIATSGLGRHGCRDTSAGIIDKGPFHKRNGAGQIGGFSLNQPASSWRRQ